jgi:hypothetical protein
MKTGLARTQQIQNDSDVFFVCRCTVDYEYFREIRPLVSISVSIQFHLFYLPNYWYRMLLVYLKGNNIVTDLINA